ncbi:hypothetical protein Pmar_PMAR006576 [Perkinsus marinus ATCC 50983]|uniref:Uncharacterized protein n=1 Tax=Perkinsus marinus (strain ATCC 50983 / TXsc) TaxID=423536 RepID=C5LTT9_PERM5|nr:hypothetical protein Pmar_PMAR006576 [Perkinsus marinus ATCC 50983]EEQ99901.1 hypothetical protein Pmar_PMAR006576 [Perkinsus marinus ATCC 50983]|eukprot:XP_002767184.1 hypothetical protein Pmar_PMAR006576 [Perkinsus marinus ATCC 50983]
MSEWSPRADESGSSVDSDNDYETFVNSLRHQSIGENERVTVPYDGSSRKLVYCDFTASGRSVSAIEEFITATVCPTYANTHSLASATARQTMHYREEAETKS